MNFYLSYKFVANVVHQQNGFEALVFEWIPWFCTGVFWFQNTSYLIISVGAYPRQHLLWRGNQYHRPLSERRQKLWINQKLKILKISRFDGEMIYVSVGAYRFTEEVPLLSFHTFKTRTYGYDKRLKKIILS